jgi:hypothetical protein
LAEDEAGTDNSLMKRPARPDTEADMRGDERFEFDAHENRFFSQLPSVLIAAAAIAVIVFVNFGAHEAATIDPAASNPLSPPAARAPASLPSATSPTNGTAAPTAAPSRA